MYTKIEVVTSQCTRILSNHYRWIIVFWYKEESYPYNDWDTLVYKNKMTPFQNIGRAGLKGLRTERETNAE